MTNIIPHRNVAPICGIAVSLLLGGSSLPGNASSAGRISIPHSLPKIVTQARAAGSVAPAERIQLAITLPLRNQAQLKDLIRALYDVNDARYHQFLTPAQFADQFGPTLADYEAAKAYAVSSGLTVTKTYSNRALLDVAGDAASVEKAFGVKLGLYRRPNGSVFRSPDRNASLPASMANVVSNVVGLDNAYHPVPLFHPVSPAASFLTPAGGVTQGTAPGGGFSPTDIWNAYNLKGITKPGEGQTLGLMELSGFNLSDIQAYEKYFNLPALTPTTVLIDGYDGSAGDGFEEVTLDIDCMLAIAPYAKEIIVYEAANSFKGLLDCYAQIAVDNKAGASSSSWGLPEDYAGPIKDSENATFMQMAAQGQGMYVAAGDAGAYDNGVNLSVDDAGSQPYVTSVGGTNLFVDGPGGAYVSETSWADPSDLGRSPFGTGGGGGISTLWTIPVWQIGVASPASLGSNTMRNTPDVSLFGDYDTGGYSIVLNGGWYVFNGTSAAAPLWAAFASLVDQARGATTGASRLGFANPALYSIATSSSYGQDFHDINDGSNNLYFPAVNNYDLSTGWGSFNGNNLIADLVGKPLVTLTLATTGSISFSWTPIQGSTGYKVYRGTAPGQESATPIAAGITQTQFKDTSVINGTRYYYKVSSLFGAKEGQKSVEISGLPLDAPALAPPVLQANGIALSWSSVKSAAGYNVYRGVYGGPITYLTSTTGLAITDTTVKNQTKYNYFVTATGPRVREESNRSIGWIILATGPKAPASLTATPFSGSVQLAWPSSVNATLYNIMRATNVAGPYSIIAKAPTLRYTDSDVRNGVTYYYEVAGIDAIGPGPASAPVSAKPMADYAAPPAPTGLTAVATTGTVQLTWSAAPRATSYTVKRATKAIGPFTAIGTTATTAYADKAVVAGTQYFYQVLATNSYGTSQASAYTGIVAK